VRGAKWRRGGSPVWSLSGEELTWRDGGENDAIDPGWLCENALLHVILTAVILALRWGDRMKRFVEGTDRGQSTLFPECLEDWVDENNPVRVIDVFVDELDLGELGFDGVAPEDIARVLTLAAGQRQSNRTTLRGLPDSISRETPIFAFPNGKSAAR